MVGRPEMPRQRNTKGTWALLLLTSCFAFPALAAPGHDTLCDEQHQATLDISADELVSRPVSHDLEAQENDGDGAEAVSASEVLKPRFDATMREVFSEGEEALPDDDAELPASLRLRVPGVSDEDLVRFKRQMFRRDI